MIVTSPEVFDPDQQVSPGWQIPTIRQMSVSGNGGEAKLVVELEVVAQPA
jgi:hypothetical protein